MGILSISEDKNELALVFDIRSSSVGAALFYREKSGVPKIIFSIREPIILEEGVDIDRFLFLTIKALKIITTKVYMKGFGAPSQFFCVLSSPWYVSQTRIISLQKNTPFVFTSKLADSLIQREIGFLQEEYFKKYEHVGNTLRPIELKNIKITLNGYEIIKPLDKSAKELEMTIFISMSAEEVLKAIEATISKLFHFREIKFLSFSIASFTVLRDMYMHQENFLLINIDGEITDISMIKNNILRESTSFPLGHNFLIRRVAYDMKTTLSEAKSLISLFKDGHAAVSITKKLGPVINNLKSQWLKKFQESLANLSNDISIPAMLYIIVDKDLADFFSEIIKVEQFNQYTLTESKFQITFLDIQKLRGIVAFDRDVNPDSLLAIDSIYINRFFN